MPQRTVQNETKHLCGSLLRFWGESRFPALWGSGPGEPLAGNSRSLLAHPQSSLQLANQGCSEVMATEIFNLDTGLFPS